MFHDYYTLMAVFRVLPTPHCVYPLLTVYCLLIAALLLLHALLYCCMFAVHATPAAAHRQAVMLYRARVAPH